MRLKATHAYVRQRKWKVALQLEEIGSGAKQVEGALWLTRGRRIRLSPIPLREHYGAAAAYLANRPSHPYRSLRTCPNCSAPVWNLSPDQGIRFNFLRSRPSMSDGSPA